MPQRTFCSINRVLQVWGTQLHNVNSVAGNIDFKNLLCNLYSCASGKGRTSSLTVCLASPQAPPHLHTVSSAA